MKTTIALMAQTIIILASLAFAAWLEWLTLRGLLRLMPARGIHVVAPARASARGRELLQATRSGSRG
jgi:hypothetical protein